LLATAVFFVFLLRYSVYFTNCFIYTIIAARTGSYHSPTLLSTFVCLMQSWSWWFH
jgi:hypothetical protein